MVKAIILVVPKSLLSDTGQEEFHLIAYQPAPRPNAQCLEVGLKGNNKTLFYTDNWSVRGRG